MKSRALVIALSVFSLLALPAGLAAQEKSQPRYRVIELGALGGTYSQSFYVTNWGMVGGEASLANGNWHAILWQGPFKKDLGTLGGLNSSVFGSLNAFGQVVGQAETSDSDPNGEDFCGFYGSGAPWSGTTCRGFLWQGEFGGTHSAPGGLQSAGGVAH